MRALSSIDGQNLPRAERRRQAILEAALRVIAVGGADAVTHRSVAAEAKVPLGSTTYYFESRDELVREAFRFYLARASQFLAAVERERTAATAHDVVEFLIDVARREFADPVMVRAEYELVLYASRNEELAREFNAWERGLEAGLAEILERLGAGRPMDAARTLIDLVRGFEIERLTRPHADVADLGRRLLPVVNALTGASSARAVRKATPRRAVRPDRRRRAERKIS
jgi:DNA-binding transcriptional regulator YbjK